DAQVLLCALRDEEFPVALRHDNIDSALQGEVYRLLGRCYLRLREPGVALDNLQIARSMTGETAKLKKAMLEYYIVQADHGMVAQLANEMLREDPTSIEAKNALGVISLEEMHFGKAIALYE